MLLKTSLLFELPVYRISKQKYYDEYKKYNQKIKDEIDYNEDLPINIFGGVWEYNEIIGFLKFYMSGGRQIRVEYHETAQKRKRKTRKKLFIYKTDRFCTRDIYFNATNEQIIEIIKNCIKNCKDKLKNRYVKTDFFDDIYQYINWQKLIENLENLHKNVKKKETLCLIML
ncbi:hypothetical protein [Nautilia sp.]